MNKEKINKQNIGNAGEYYIASVLSSRNFVVTITLGRNEKYDILAVNPTGKTYKISVKTLYKFNKNKKYHFPLTEKYENLKEDDLFYAFVSLNEFKIEPDYWIVPSEVVADFIKEVHSKWEKTPGKKGQQHNKTKMRGFDTYKTKYTSSNWEEEIKKYYKNIEQLQ